MRLWKNIASIYSNLSQPNLCVKKTITGFSFFSQQIVFSDKRSPYPKVRNNLTIKCLPTKKLEPFQKISQDALDRDVYDDNFIAYFISLRKFGLGLLRNLGIGTIF